jgi:hypothetical protein
MRDKVVRVETQAYQETNMTTPHEALPAAISTLVFRLPNDSQQLNPGYAHRSIE